MMIGTAYHNRIMTFGFILMSLVFRCKSAEAVISKDDVKALETVKKILDTKAYDIEISTIYPQNTVASAQAINSLLLRQTGNSASRIDVSGDNYSIKLKDSVAEGDLPFFGESRFSSGGYNGSSSGINLDGKTQDYSLTFNVKKNNYVVEFTTRDSKHKIESYKVQLTIFLNRNVDVYITSSHRTMIRYLGVLSEIELEE
jgi:hypothetical protein